MQEIADWLERLDMSEYAECFAENDIDSAILVELTDQDLEKMVKSLGHRRKILRAIGRGGDGAGRGGRGDGLSLDARLQFRLRRSPCFSLSEYKGDLRAATAPARQTSAEEKMKPVKVEFQFDFGSPNAYLAQKVLPEIERRTGARFEYVPVLLGGIFKLTNNRSPAESLAGIKNKPEFMELETRRFIRRHGITTFKHNPFFPINTLQLMRGAVAAQFEGIFEPYFRAAYHHMWEAPKKMDDPQVAREAFISSNVDFDRLFARSQQPDVKSRLLKVTQDAVARGAFGSPTFFVGEEMFFGKDQLRDVEEAIVAVGAETAEEPQQARS
jgi:2-hydroxychromene-2-carboxylate isomerase